ncbi:MAG: YqgE/AlgH family protein [Thermodesulfobacteriota bacterium]
MDSLTGYFLIATPQMPDPRFARKVIYLCSHTAEDGAMGLVLNDPIEDVSLAALYESMDMPTPEILLPSLYFGGPVEIEAVFILHSSDYRARQCFPITSQVHLSRDALILRDIAAGRGPHHYRFCLGYSGWAPGQLENELSVDGWLTLPADFEDIFATDPEQMWEKITAKHGIDISIFGEIIGRA